MATQLPGSDGEHELQQIYATKQRAERFYSRQVLDHLNSRMTAHIARQSLMFIATADGQGNCDCSIRAGKPGFVRVVDSTTLIYPEYRGNGVMASLGNILENPHIGVVFPDLTGDQVGLHINGEAVVVENTHLASRLQITDNIAAELQVTGVRRPERWVHVSVHEAYIHCSKHIPRLASLDKTIDWGTDDERKKGGDYFGIKGTQADQPVPAPHLPPLHEKVSDTTECGQ